MVGVDLGGSQAFANRCRGRKLKRRKVGDAAKVGEGRWSADDLATAVPDQCWVHESSDPRVHPVLGSEAEKDEKFVKEDRQARD